MWEIERVFHFNIHLCEIIATEIFMYSEREKEFVWVCVFVCVWEWMRVSLFHSSSSNNNIIYKSLLLLYRYRITALSWKHLVAWQVTTLTHLGNCTRFFSFVCLVVIDNEQTARSSFVGARQAIRLMRSQTERKIRSSRKNASATICVCVAGGKRRRIFFLLYHVFKLGWMNLELLYVLELIRSGEILV